MLVKRSEAIDKVPLSRECSATRTDFHGIWKEKDMLMAGKYSYIEEEKFRLQDEHENQVINDFLEHYSSLLDEEIEHYDDRMEARKGIKKYEKLVKKGKEEILKMKREIMEIKTQQKIGVC